jgi:hypothetical protein
VNKRRSEQLVRVAFSALRPDETIELLSMAKVGTPSRKKQVWVLLLTTILTLGLLQLYVVARPYYLVLTSQRLLLFTVTRGSASPGKLQRQIALPGLTATSPRGVLAAKFYLSVKDGTERLRLVFTPQRRNDANTLAGRIGITE